MSSTSINTEMVSIRLAHSRVTTFGIGRHEFTCQHHTDESVDTIKQVLRAFKRVEYFSFSGTDKSRLVVEFNMNGVDSKAVHGFVAAASNDLLRAIERASLPDNASVTPTPLAKGIHEKPRYNNFSRAGRR